MKPMSEVHQAPGLQTEFEFTLPRGYLDNSGRLHRRGSMRLAKARDEILAMQDPAVRANPAYLAVWLLSRVILHLGELPIVTPAVIEDLFASDLSYLEEVYLRLNALDTMVVGAVCPDCRAHFQLQVAPLEISGD